MKKYFLLWSILPLIIVSMVPTLSGEPLSKGQELRKRLIEEADREALYKKCMDEVRALEDDKLVALALNYEVSRNERIGAALVMLRERASPEVAEALVPAMNLAVGPSLYGGEKYGHFWQTFPVAAQMRKYPELVSQVIEFGLTTEEVSAGLLFVLFSFKAAGADPTAILKSKLEEDLSEETERRVRNLLSALNLDPSEI